MRTRAVALSAIYYIVVAALLCGVLFKLWVEVLPKGVATRVGHNSEGYLIALVLAAWIQFVRPKLTGTRAEWVITVIVAVAFVALTVVMLTTHWPSRFKTLNEGTAGIALMIPYVQIRRPFPKRAALVALVVVIVATIITNKSAETTDMAETYAMVILGIAAFDMIDTGILNPKAVTSASARWIWYAFLVIAPIIFSLAEYHWGAGDTGFFGDSMRWLVRVTEAFIFVLFIEIFFAVGLGRTGNAARTPQVETPQVETPQVGAADANVSTEPATA